MNILFWVLVGIWCVVFVFTMIELCIPKLRKNMICFLICVVILNLLSVFISLVNILKHIC